MSVENLPRVRSEHDDTRLASDGEPPSQAHLQGAQAQPHSLSLKEEIKQFEEKYADLVVSVRNAFKRLGVSFEKVLSQLLQLPVSLRHCAKLLQSEASRLARASSIDELFFILSPHWDFLNPGLLAHLAYRFGDDQTIRSVDEYLGELREFRMRTKIGDFIDVQSSTLPPDTQEIVMELGDNWREKALEQLEELSTTRSRKLWFQLIHGVQEQGDQLTSSLEAATPTLPLLIPPTPLTLPSSTDSANHPKDAQAQQFSLKEEIRQFEEKYTDLTVTVQNAFITEGVSVKMILRCLQVLPASLKQQCGEFLQFQAAHLSQASSINELFFILSPHWDFLNPGLLAHLAHKFGDEQTIKSLKEYLAELREFQMRTKIGNFTGASVHSINIQPPGRFQQLRSDHQQVPQSMSLQDQDWTAAVVSSPIGSAGGKIHWEEYGIDIEIPPGAITSDVCQQFVLTCHVPEKVKFQKSYIPIGPLFTIRPPCKFKKNISISFQHWADADCIKSTSMQPRVLCASDLETFSAGKFTELPNVNYDEERITATCNHFCVFCTAMKMKILRRGACTCSYKYTAVLHLPQRCIPGETWTAVFSISRKSRVFAEALKQILEEKCKHEYCYQYSPTIHFSQSNVATLNIPMDDAETQGYHVEPCRPYTQMGLEANQISKKEVDNPFSDFHGVNPPQIQLFISPWDPNAIPTKPLDCKLRLEGITDETTINFKVPPSSFQVPGSPTTEGEGSSCPAILKGKFSAAGEECTWEDQADTTTSMPGSSPAEEGTSLTKCQKEETATDDTPVQLSSRPTLPELLNFHGRKRKIKTAQEIGSQYTNFGILLLEDKTGAKVAAITDKHKGNAELINIEILQEWVSGRGKKPVS